MESAKSILGVHSLWICGFPYSIQLTCFHPQIHVQSLPVSFTEWEKCEGQTFSPPSASLPHTMDGLSVACLVLSAHIFVFLWWLWWFYKSHILVGLSVLPTCMYILYDGHGRVVNIDFTFHIYHLSWNSLESNCSAIHSARCQLTIVTYCAIKCGT